MATPLHYPKEEEEDPDIFRADNLDFINNRPIPGKLHKSRSHVYLSHPNVLLYEYKRKGHQKSFDSNDISDLSPTMKIQPLPIIKDITDQKIKIEYDHTKLYYWGLFPNQDTYTSIPVNLVEIKSKIKYLIGKEMRCIILTKCGDVYIQDDTHKFINANSSLLLERALFNDIIISISTGIDHILALTFNGLVYSWGDGSQGQLGLNKFTKVPNPHCITSLSNINSIGCGNFHSIAITNKGELFIWGTSLSCCLKSNKNVFIPKLISKVKGSNNYMISAGLDFTLILLQDEGILYSIGASSEGQCGNGTTDLYSKLSTIELLYSNSPENRIYQISCGQSHCLALSLNGNIYSWGNGELGQLGLSEIYKQAIIPFKINTNDNIKFKQICCGSFHSLAISESNQLYGWGYNYDDFFYRKEQTNTIFTPVLIDFISDINSVATGSQWIAYDIITDTNQTEEPYDLSSTYFTASSPVATPTTSNAWDRLESGFFYKRNSNETKELVYGSIPKQYRDKFWILFVGNRVHFTPELYTLFKEKIAIKKAIKDSIFEGIMSQIDKDVRRTLPYLHLFAPSEPLNESIIDILTIFVEFRPDLQYVQSLSYIAATVCIYFQNDTYLAVQFFLNLLTSGVFISLLRLYSKEINDIWSICRQYLEIGNLPLINYFKSIDLDISTFLLPWFMTIYAQYLPLDIVSYIFDLLCYEGSPILFKVAFVILDLLTQELINTNFDTCLFILKQSVGYVEPWKKLITFEVFIQKMTKFTLPKNISKLIDNFERNVFIQK